MYRLLQAGSSCRRPEPRVGAALYCALGQAFGLLSCRSAAFPPCPCRVSTIELRLQRQTGRSPARIRTLLCPLRVCPLYPAAPYALPSGCAKRRSCTRLSSRALISIFSFAPLFARTNLKRQVKHPHRESRQKAPNKPTTTSRCPTSANFCRSTLNYLSTLFKQSTGPPIDYLID